MKFKFAPVISLVFCFISFSELSLYAQTSHVKSKETPKTTNLKDNTQKSQASKKNQKKYNQKNEKQNYVQKPKLKPDENAVFFEHEYRIFKTKKVDGIDYSLNCFKNNSPNCKAYNAVKEDYRWNATNETYESNLAARLCRQHQGRALIAINSKNEEFDICRFTDGSIYSSWQVYYKLDRQQLTQ